MIVQLALEQAADHTHAMMGLETDINSAPSNQDALNDDAYKRLLPKITDLSAEIDDKSEADFGSWLGALPQDEFIQFIGITDQCRS